MRHAIAATMTLALALALAGCAGMEDFGLSGNRPVDEATVVAGLKEALRVGTERTVDQVSIVGGYLERPEIRIPLPDTVQDLAGTLRRVGLGAKADELETAMNHAAEKAATEAIDVFGAAITGMTIEDAWSILRGQDTAATDYFRQKTSAELQRRYRPIVESKLRTVGGYQEYEDLVARLEALPLVDPPDLDLVGYVTDEALDGLFTVLADEERRIRDDPLARTTDLLRRVFGDA